MNMLALLTYLVLSSQEKLNAELGDTNDCITPLDHSVYAVKYLLKPL